MDKFWIGNIVSIVKDLLSDGTIKIGMKKKEKKPFIIKQMIQNPEDYKMEAYIEGEEIIVKFKRKETES